MCLRIFLLMFARESSSIKYQREAPLTTSIQIDTATFVRRHCANVSSSVLLRSPPVAPTITQGSSRLIRLAVRSPHHEKYAAERTRRSVRVHLPWLTG